MDTIKTLYNKCQIINKDLTDIIVDNYEIYRDFVDWINNHKLYVNKINILKNNTNETLAPPINITEFYVKKQLSYERSVSGEWNDMTYSPTQERYSNNDIEDFPVKPLLFFNFNTEDDSIVI